MKEVVVTGYGAVTPLGVGADSLHERWTAGDCGLRDGVGRCSDFQPTTFVSVREARRTDRFTQLAIGAGDEALARAGWIRGSLPYPPERIGCIVGTGIGGIATLENQHDILRERGRDWLSPLAVPLMMSNAAAATLGIRYGLRGESHSVVAACAAGAQSLGAALRLIQVGQVDAVVVGGTESALTPLTRAGFGRMGATSACGISRPFDRRRDGFVIAEGAGVLVFEERTAAAARGAVVLGSVLGYGATSDALHITAPDGAGTGARMAIQAALDDAGLGVADVDYVNLHGTSTQLNDRSETVAVKHVFGSRAGAIPMSSTKSATGHMLGAAGAVELIATLLALKHRVAPPTLGYGEPEDGLDLDYVTDGARALSGSGRLVGVSNAFGFGGHNAVLAVSA